MKKKGRPPKLIKTAQLSTIKEHIMEEEPSAQRSLVDPVESSGMLDLELGDIVTAVPLMGVSQE